jgi:hypothetical protein
MTIRDYLKRRRNEMVQLVLPGIVFCVLSAVFVRGSFWLNCYSLATLLGGIVASIVLMRGTPCPKCQVPFGSLASRAANGWAKTAHCPNCGVSLDEPMGSPASHN